MRCQPGIISELALLSVLLPLNPALSGMNNLRVLVEQTGGAVFDALAGGERSASNNQRATVTGSLRVSRSVLSPVNWRSA